MTVASSSKLLAWSDDRGVAWTSFAIVFIVLIIYILHSPSRLPLEHMKVSFVCGECVFVMLAVFLPPEFGHVTPDCT
jgi:hypothetical protein